MKKPRKGYQQGGPIGEDPKFTNKRAFNEYYKKLGYQNIPNETNTWYDPKKFSVTPASPEEQAKGRTYEYKSLDPKISLDAYGGIPSEHVYSYTAPPSKPFSPNTPVQMSGAQITVSPPTPPAPPRMVPNSMGQMGTGTYAIYDPQGKPVWYGSQGALPVQAKANGGWVDAQGNAIDVSSDPNLSKYSEQELIGLGYKKSGMQGGDVASALGQSNIYGAAGNLAGAGLQSYLDKKHGGGPSVSGSTVGGALRGAGTGAQIGSQIGNTIAPGIGGAVGASFGALMGAGAGAGIGLLKGKKGVQEHKQIGEMDATQQAMANQYNPYGTGSYTSPSYNPKDYKKTFGVQGFYADGGKVKGGKIEGAGGPKDDDIKAKVQQGSFVVPAENSKVAEYLRSKYLTKGNEKANLKQKGGESVYLSNGEHLFTPKETEELYKNGIELNMLAPNSDDNQYAPQNWHFKKGGLTPDKAKEILHDKSVHGHPLTAPQRRYFGAVASGHARKAEGGTVKMDKGEFVEEHKELVDVLRRGTKKERLKEANEQAEEIKGYADGGGIGEDPYDMYRKTGKKEDPYDKYSYIARMMAKKQPVNDTFKGIGPQAPASPLGSKATKEAKKVGAAPQESSLLEAIKFDPSKALTMPDTYENAIVTPGAQQPVAKAQGPKLYTTGGDQYAGTEPGSGVPKRREMDMGMLLGAAQAGLGASYLINQGKRPTYSVGPTFQGQLADTLRSSKYGFSPEQKAFLQNQAIENRNQALANVASAAGGNAGVALNNMRAVFNDSYQNRLRTASDDESLRMQKMSSANPMATQDEAYRRRQFEDKLGAFMQNQQAGANLLSAGIENVLGANRLKQEREANDQIMQMMYGR